MINIKKVLITLIAVVLIVCLLKEIITIYEKSPTVQTSGSVLSNTKIGWGVKREKDHKQPDLGQKNIELMNKYEGLAMGNSESKKVYLTFDQGYEAGYTAKILDALKENDVKATFFVTAHYINTAPDLIQRMIDEGHIVGNHTPNFLMSGNDINVKC